MTLLKMYKQYFIVQTYFICVAVHRQKSKRIGIERTTEQERHAYTKILCFNNAM